MINRRDMFASLVSLPLIGWLFSKPAEANLLVSGNGLFKTKDNADFDDVLRLMRATIPFISYPNDSIKCDYFEFSVITRGDRKQTYVFVKSDNGSFSLQSVISGGITKAVEET